MTDVRVEYAPAPRAEYLDNGSSFDAFVGYVDADGERAFLGVETKLTEPFTQSGTSSPRAEPHYRGVTEREDSVWREEAWPTRRHMRWRQLRQNHLLVEAVRRHPDRPHGGRGLLVLVSHPDDLDCARTAAAYKSTLAAADTSFVDLPLDALVPAWQSVVAGEQDRR